MVDTIHVLPQPQAEALHVALGLKSGSSPDRYLVGLAVLTLMSEVAVAQPLLCVVDDAQWLDRSTTQALAFVARRLGADSVGLVLASRGAVDELEGVQELQILGLETTDSALLLDSVLAGGHMDRHVRDGFAYEPRDGRQLLSRRSRWRGPTPVNSGRPAPRRNAELV